MLDGSEGRSLGFGKSGPSSVRFAPPVLETARVGVVKIRVPFP